MPATREAWDGITKSTGCAQATKECAELYRRGDTKGYDLRKRSLPLACYMCTFDVSHGSDPKKPKAAGRWRSQKAARLNGLIMHDFDKLSKKGIDPAELYSALPNHWFDVNTCPHAVLLAHVTPSGDGLRLVTIANPDLDIEQNQQMILGYIKAIDPVKFAALEADGSCINADRGSFVVGSENILYINERIFDYDNPRFDEKFGNKYRTGHVSGTAGEGRVESVAESYPTAYHGVEYSKILDAWFEEAGGEPQSGDRHKTMLRLVSDLRYICDNSVGFIRSVIMQCEFVKNWVKADGAGKELDDIITSATSKELWWGTPKRLKAALDRVGVQLEVQRRADGFTEEQERQAFVNFWKRLEPLMTEPYLSACQIVNDANKLAAVFVSGTMYCTLMTRCFYEHYDGKLTRLNPTTFVIGTPASGKSFAVRLDDSIMAAMRGADAPGRKAEREYKRKQKERASSSKAQKGDPLQPPTEVIRYLPSKTSNSIFFRRAENAKETIDGDIFRLHLYMFDSELDSAVGAQKSDWAGKHDLELKAFHNESSGVDYANLDSVNDLIPIYWNQVITGTPVSLHKKFTLRNINDGFCTRVAIVKMWPDKYRMMERGSRTVNHETEVTLKEWGYRFDSMRGELKIDKLVDHVYNICANFAEEAGSRNDDVLDLLRKRAAYYAVWFTIPRIYGRQWDRYRETGEVTIDDSDLQFATVIYEAVIFWQDYYFGRMLSDSWQNAENEIQPRSNKSKNALAFTNLPKVFDENTVMNVLNINLVAARTQISRWKQAGYIKVVEDSRPKSYEKIVDHIMI